MRVFAAAVAAMAVILGLATPAQAVTYNEKLQVATAWSQATSASQAAWNGARLDQARWSAYGFDWSTDYCSSSPDRPAGFDFRLSCYRHDFGYRNFKRLGVFPANKARIDDAFYFDLKQVCARYSGVAKSTCLSLAWSYYNAVRRFGSLQVTEAEVNRIAEVA
jgi:Prokaryotic phospholipase A2